MALATFEPVWGSVFSSERRPWAVDLERHKNPFFSLSLANPLISFGTSALIVYGAVRRWLNSYEVVLSAGLLLIPYVTRSHEMSMLSFARFASVVAPQSLVCGRLVARLPPRLQVLLFSLAAFYLGLLAALFAAGHLVI